MKWEIGLHPHPWDEGIIMAAWRNAWELAGDSSIFQSPVLAALWVNQVAIPRGEAPVLLVGSDGRRTVYMPFTVRQRRYDRLWRRELWALGGNLVFDYQDPLVDGEELDQDDWRGFWRELRERAGEKGISIVSIPHLHALAVRGFCSSKPHASSEVSMSTSALSIALRDYSGYEEWFSCLAPSQRQSIRRKMKKLQQDGVSLRVVPQDALQEGEQFIETFMDAYHHQHNSRNPEHQFTDPINRAFYNEMVRVGLPAGWLHLSSLQAGGSIVSWHLGFHWKGRFAWYKPCYGTDKRGVSPGQLHIDSLVRLGYQEGWEVFDFTIGREDYKTHWTKREEPVYALRLFTDRIAGRFHRVCGLLKGGTLQQGFKESNETRIMQVSAKAAIRTSAC